MPPTAKELSIGTGDRLRQALFFERNPAYGTAAALTGQLDLRDDQRCTRAFEEEKEARIRS